MITEDYVSYEVAKLLKEKGFDEPCQKCYYVSTKSIEDVHNGRNTILSSFFISCPTLQMATKWLRETHGIDIIIEISDPSVKDRKYYCIIWDGNNNSYILDLFNSYEEACEAAIEYVLENLI